MPAALVPEERSLARRLIDSGQWDSEMAKASAAERQALAFDLDFIGRPQQIATVRTNARRTWVFCGRAWGKTWCFSHFVRHQIYERGVPRGAIVGQTARDVRQVLVHGPAGLMNALHPSERPVPKLHEQLLKFPPGKNCPHGAEVVILYGDTITQSRGGEVGFMAIDEFAKYQYPTELLQTAAPMLRGERPDGTTNQMLVTTTPRPLESIIKARARAESGDPTIRLVYGGSRENCDLPPGALDEMIREVGYGTRLYQQEIEGKILDDIPGALWSPDMIERCRFPAPMARNEAGRMVIDWDAVLADMSRIVIAVDPAGVESHGDSGDEIGLMAVGKHRPTGCAMVMWDMSCRVAPSVWADRIVQSHDRFNADACVVETNFGKGVVKQLIQSAAGRGENRIKIIGVHARKKKELRAEPVANAYAAGRVLHLTPQYDPENPIGSYNLAQVEDQMGQISVEEGWCGSGSPDRLDALVYGVTEILQLDGKRRTGGPIARNR